MCIKVDHIILLTPSCGIIFVLKGISVLLKDCKNENLEGFDNNMVYHKELCKNYKNSKEMIKLLFVLLRNNISKI